MFPTNPMIYGLIIIIYIYIYILYILLPVLLSLLPLSLLTTDWYSLNHVLPWPLSPSPQLGSAWHVRFLHEINGGRPCQGKGDAVQRFHQENHPGGGHAPIKGGTWEAIYFANKKWDLHEKLGFNHQKSDFNRQNLGFANQEMDFNHQ